MSWDKALKRAGADKPVAAEPGEIIVHPDQDAMFEDLDTGPVPVKPKERYEIHKHCPLFDGHPKVTRKLL